MEKNEIILRETENNGQTIYLYYDDTVGLYLAFGLSAYYVTMVVEPQMSYSEKMKMPVALLQKLHILQLRQGLKKMEHIVKKFYCFQIKLPVGRGGYEQWSQKIHERHERI